MKTYHKLAAAGCAIVLVYLNYSNRSRRTLDAAPILVEYVHYDKYRSSAYGRIVNRTNRPIQSVELQFQVHQKFATKAAGASVTLTGIKPKESRPFQMQMDSDWQNFDSVVIDLENIRIREPELRVYRRAPDTLREAAVSKGS